MKGQSVKVCMYHCAKYRTPQYEKYWDELLENGNCECDQGGYCLSCTSINNKMMRKYCPAFTNEPQFQEKGACRRSQSTEPLSHPSF